MCKSVIFSNLKDFFNLNKVLNRVFILKRNQGLKLIVNYVLKFLLSSKFLKLIEYVCILRA